jgi:hypothetical protein
VPLPDAVARGKASLNFPKCAMSSLAISAIIFVCIFVSALLGMLLRSRLHEEHLSSDSKDIVKLGMGLVGTMTALVLGLLVAAAKSAHDTQQNGVAQLAANIIVLDRALAHYGTETKDLREQLRTSLTDMLQRTWPEEYPASERPAAPSRTEGRYEAVFEKILALTPKNDAQRAFQAQAMKSATDIAQLRWQLFAQKGSSISTPLLVVMVSWLCLLFGSFGLFAPPNAITVVSLLISALVLSSALFLILELDQPFNGIIKIPSTPLRDALEQLGK